MTQPLVFMYSGQGAQYYQMGKELFQESAIFRQSLEQCAAIIDPLIGQSLVAEIYRGSKAEPFEKTRLTHPANVAIAYSLTQVLAERGLRPDVLLGYSLGEFIAAMISGAIGLEAGLRTITQQALILERTTPAATMLAILEDVGLMKQNPSLFAGSTLACHNFQNHFVVTGSHQDLKRIEQTLFKQEVTVQMLPISHGFHSPIIDPAEAEIVASMEGLFSQPKLPCYSAASRDRVEKYSSAHMWRVLRGQVNFYELILKLEEELAPIYIDVGPAGTLTTFTKYALGNKVTSRAHMTINPFGRDLKTLNSLFSAMKL